MKSIVAISAAVWLLASATGCADIAPSDNPKEISVDDSFSVRNDALEKIAVALKSTSNSVRLDFHGSCHMNDGGVVLFPQLALHPVAKNHDGLDAIRDLFSGDPGVMISESSGGIVRIRIGKVSDNLLNTTVHSVVFSEMAQFNPNIPNGAIDTIENTPEVRAKMAQLSVAQVSTPLMIIGRPPRVDFPHLPASISDTTVSQLLDSVAQTFGGIVFYGECKNSSGDGLIDIGFKY